VLAVEEAGMLDDGSARRDAAAAGGRVEDLALPFALWPGSPGR
jgi:hypothetical protein